MNISIVIPLLNEEESLPELTIWIERIMLKHNFSYEILFIDDGSTDQSWGMIQDLQQTNSNVKGIRFLKNYGKSQALHAGFQKAQGNVVITMDADLQDSPDEIPELFDLIQNNGYHLVSGWKKKRYDNVVMKNLPSKLFNWAARMISGVKLHDFNCGLKAYQNNVIKNIEVSGEMHRYIPILAKNAGFSKIGEKVVVHQARKYGTSKFGLDRFVNGFLDLITIWFLSKFGKRPMHFFGMVGTLLFLFSFMILGYIIIDKLFIHTHSKLISERTEFYLLLTAMIIGTQMFLAGFLGEMILRSKNNEERYKIKESL